MSTATARKTCTSMPSIDIILIRITACVACIGWLFVPAVSTSNGAADVTSTATTTEVCQCITHSGTGGNEWGALIIAPNNSYNSNGKRSSVRIGHNASSSSGGGGGHNNKTDCLVVYIRAAPDEIVELRFYEIRLRESCQDSIQIHAHLRSATISETARNDEIICTENAGQYIANRHPHAVDLFWEDHVANTNVISATASDVHANEEQNRVEASRIRINNQRAILSSGHLLGVHLKYNASAEVTVSAKADFRFHKKALFKIDGNLLPTTLCDYQFLPYPINSGPRWTQPQQQQQPQQRQPTLTLHSPTWRYFFSPRYPAKYAGHVKCAYKFIGRPNSHVEVVFQEIDLPPAVLQNNASRSCISVSDRLTIYDSRTPDTSAVIDVLCQAHYRKKILSSGAHLLIEFESSSNRSANGFSAKYRFVQTAAGTATAPSSSLFSSLSDITLNQHRTFIKYAVQVPSATSSTAKEQDDNDSDNTHSQSLSPRIRSSSSSLTAFGMTTGASGHNDNPDNRVATNSRLLMPSASAESANGADQHYILTGSSFFSSSSSSNSTSSNQSQAIKTDDQAIDNATAALLDHLDSDAQQRQHNIDDNRIPNSDNSIGIHVVNSRRTQNGCPPGMCPISL